MSEPTLHAEQPEAPPPANELWDEAKRRLATPWGVHGKPQQYLRAEAAEGEVLEVLVRRRGDGRVIHAAVYRMPGRSCLCLRPRILAGEAGRIAPPPEPAGLPPDADELSRAAE